MKLPTSLGPLLRKTPLAGGDSRVILELDASRGAAEAPPANPLQALRGLHTPQLRTLVEHLRKAADDDGVAALIGNLGSATLTLAQAGELHAAVRHFAASGKPTAAFAPTYGELTPGTIAYYLATAFAEIWVQPSGAVGLVGFAGEATTVRGTLDLLRAEPEFGQRHDYKTAANTMMSKEITDAHREMTERLLTSCNEIVTAAVASHRSLSVERVQELMAAGPLAAEEAREAGLIDRVGYRDEAYAALRARAGAEELRYVDRWGTGPFDHLFGGGLGLPSRRPVVAVVTAHGPIQLGRGESRSPLSGPVVGADTLGAVLRAAGRLDRVCAVVLRIDSPGGSYVASDQLRRELLTLREAGIPVVASMGSVAASGGYFIAMPADHIVANAGTITGSIGVLAGKISTGKSTAALGITRETIATTAYSAMFSGNRRFTDEEWELLNQWLDAVYADFTTKAAHDRGMDISALEPLARGRVWTGADAHDRGLVDSLGGLESAIGEACRLAGVARGDVAVQSLPKSSPLQLLNPPKSSDAVGAASAYAGMPTEGPVAWQRLLPTIRTLLGEPGAGVLSLPPYGLPGLLPPWV